MGVLCDAECRYAIKYETMRFARLVVPDLLLDILFRDARAAAPLECCGLLAGHIADGVGIVTTRFTIGNDGASPTAYETNARDMLRAFRAMRESGIELLAIYHSHPASEPVPSRRDIECNTYGDSVVHLIVSLAGAKPEARGWWLAEDGCCEAAVEVVEF
jgi:[CysO sulfur-carrier protein]-S-L-cysteine hydrolase